MTPESPRRARLNARTIALVGLMGAGKTTVGRRLAQALNMPFRDADAEIEAAAGRSVSDIFQSFGETAFRDGERRVIARLLDEPPLVLATGGGAFIDDDTRPLLAGKDPLEVLRAHALARYDRYGEAHITVETGETAHQTAVDAIITA